MRNRRPLSALLIWVAAALAGTGGLTSVSIAQSRTERAALDRYCVTCHNDRLRTAGLSLQSADLDQLGRDAQIWEKVAAKLRARAMPPPSAPKPDAATYDGLVSWLEAGLDRAAAAHPNPGRTPTFHRLNRTEYRNAVRDLLALQVDVADLLPADDVDEHGFDNMGEVLTVSPALLDRYLSAAHKIARLAVGIAPYKPTLDTYKVNILMVQDDQMSEDLPFGSRGGRAIRHNFPVDGEYDVKIRLFRNYVDYIRGLGTQQDLEVRLDGALVKRFSVGGENHGRAAPASFAGNIFGDPDWEKYALFSDDSLQVRFGAKAGPHVLGVSFVRQLAVPEGVSQPRQMGFALSVNEMPDGYAAVDTITLGGPYVMNGPGETPSRQRLLACVPKSPKEERTCGTAVLSTLAQRAYRRPVTPADVQTLLKFYDEGRADGSFDAGIEHALERVLISPDFLFRIERDPAKAQAASYRINDFELASRLSFFLWSSIPDDELLELARRGRLSEPATLDRQVERMLNDEKSRALVDNFASQWLGLKDLSGLVPDPVQFPEFDENLREAMREETELFLEDQIHRNRSLTELLTADYTFLNERLAQHYGIPNVYGPNFRRVTLVGDQLRRRAGLLGQGSLLTATAYPNRTSPVLRGKWVMTNLFGTPPPAPPPNVAALPERGQAGKAATVRERLETHRNNPVCASCHSRMDPLGFALENFSPIGAWREKDESGLAVDSSGTLTDGSRFRGVDGLRDVLMQRQEQFVQTITERLLAYALGRKTEYYDRPLIRSVTRNAAAHQYCWSDIILGIIDSQSFQMRRRSS
jgi:hypothetical protein